MTNPTDAQIFLWLFNYAWVFGCFCLGISAYYFVRGIAELLFSIALMIHAINEQKPYNVVASIQYLNIIMFFVLGLVLILWKPFSA